MLTTNIPTRGGAPNEKLELKKLLTYMKSVYRIPQKIKRLSDKRQRKGIPFQNPLMIVLVCFILQYRSFHEIFTYQTSRNRIKHIVTGKIPKTDAAREILKNLDTKELREIHESIIETVYKNKVFRQGTIGGYTVVAIDGVELFSSYHKNCQDCLTRKHTQGETEYFHRSVVCMSVGSNPHIVLGQDMLKPRDGAEKDEGELTGGKRLIRHLYERYHHFADVVVADALYLNAPFIQTVQECKMNVVIRLKDERRHIFKDAESLFHTEGEKEGFKKGRITVKVWDLSGFELEGMSGRFRVLKYEEYHPGEKETRRMWVVTDLEYTDDETIWTMMHRRWDIELNGFHQLKTYYHVNHCYAHAATENIFLLNILAFNIRELYLYRRKKTYKESGISRREITKRLDDELLVNDYKKLLYEDDG